MFLRIICRKFGTNANTSTKQICIIGGGPAGFYFAQHTLKALPNALVDIYERLPVPFGLVRYGVAPDHPEVKNVINTFTKTASNSNLRFIGNVSVGKDIPFSEFCKSYHAVVLAYGCSEDCNLGIKGEQLSNCISARCFVGWYNGLPDNKDLKVDLSSENVAILGQGNVAVDVARILLSPTDQLKKTDIASYALEALDKSKVKKVHLVGRRGPLQVAFTIKEFREITKLPNTKVEFRPEQLENVEKFIPELPRARKRLTELMLKTHKSEQAGSKVFNPLFFRRPVEVIGDSKVAGVKFNINNVLDPVKGTVTNSEKFEELGCGLVLRSIGYKATCPDGGIPFDGINNRIKDCSGVYSTGWINTGPVGVILSTMSNAFKQAAKLADDIGTNKLKTNDTRPGYQHIREILKKKGIVTVNFAGWQRINKAELELGAKLGKSREKIVSIEEMLRIGGEVPV